MIRYKEEKALIKSIASRIESVVKTTNFNSIIVDTPFFVRVMGIDANDEPYNNRWVKIDVSSGQYEQLIKDFLHSDKFQEILNDCIDNRLTDLGKKKLSEITIYT